MSPFEFAVPTWDYRLDGWSERDAYLHEEHAPDCECFPCNYEEEGEGE